MIATVTLSPALDVTMTLPALKRGGVNRAASTRADAGGKGVNVSKTLRALGADSVAYGALGGAAGEEILRLLDRDGVRSDFVAVERPTRRNVKLVDLERGETTEINAAPEPLGGEAYARVLRKLLDALGDGDIAVIAGKAPPDAQETLYAEWTEALRARGVRVMIDAEGGQLARALGARPELVKPNAEEAFALTGLEGEAAALALTRRGALRVLLTMGAHGAVYADGRVLLRATPPAISALSAVGAGDAAMAAMAFAADRGMTAEDAVRLAMASGAAKASLPGTQAPAADDLDRLLPFVAVTRL